MNFILLTNNTELYSNRRLLEEAQKLGLNCTHLAPNDTLLNYDQIEDPKQGIFFHRSTGMLYDDFDLLIAQKYQQAGATIINPIETLKQLRDKELQASFFRTHNIPMIPTLSLRGRPTEQTIEEIASISADQSYVVKTIRGNQGIGVNLINGKQSLASLLETFWAIGDQRFIIQPRINCKAEYRVLFCAGKILGVIAKDESAGDFRKNSKRAPASSLAPSELDEKVLSVAQKAYQCSKAFIAGVDVMETHQNEILLLELNLVPGFKQMEELTLQNIAKEMIKESMENL